MKNILLAIFLITIPVVAFSQNKAINKFYRKHKRGDDVQNMKLPGWLIKTGGKIAVKNADMEESEEQMAKDLIKQAGGVKFMYSEDGGNIPKKDVQELKEGLYKDNFDDLIRINSSELNFELMIQEIDGVVKNLLVFYNNTEDGEMAFISMKMNLKLDEVTEMVHKQIEDNYHELFFIEEEEKVAPTM